MFKKAKNYQNRIKSGKCWLILQLKTNSSKLELQNDIFHKNKFVVIFNVVNGILRIIFDSKRN